jgi:YHS domain-containing protein
MNRNISISFLAFGLVVLASACSSAPKPADQIVVTHKAADKMNVEFDGKCAMGVANGLMDHLGKADYRVDYKNKTYYFESADARDKFLKQIDKNVKRANLAWARGKTTVN